jgi:peptidoglycan/LPS O-acetylase OafA/YrhL
MRQQGERFYLLDALRGLAALSIVLWHWQHFFPPETFSAERQPLYRPLILFYTNGLRAVDVFFCLSGFIFFWLYAEKISSSRISAREFFILRFSRLYPLHLATLVFVAVAQFIYWNARGAFFIYPENDAYHFLLHSALASSFGLERGYSFNGPAWSISVEAFLYALFFLSCRIAIPRWFFCLLAILSGVALWAVYAPIARGLVSFFIGGCAYLAYSWMARRRLSLAIPCVALAALCWGVTLAQTWFGLFEHSAALPTWWSIFLLFPLTVLALALAETARGILGKPLSFLGDISYSSYLIQFPLQLVFVGAASLAGLRSEHFYSPAMMALFFLVLFCLSMASSRYFERPVQRWIRQAA